MAKFEKTYKNFLVSAYFPQTTEVFQEIGCYDLKTAIVVAHSMFDSYLKHYSNKGEPSIHIMAVGSQSKKFNPEAFDKYV